MKIGTKTINRSISLISFLLNNYRTELDEAYLKAEDALSVSLKVKFSPGKYNTIDIKADVSFVKTGTSTRCPCSRTFGAKTRS